MAVMFGLCRIVIGRYIAVLTAKDRQNFLIIGGKSVQVIGQSDMTDQITVRCAKQRQVVGDQPAGGMHDQAGKRKGIDQSIDDLWVMFLKMRRIIQD